MSGKPAYWDGGTYPWLNSSQVNRGFIDCIHYASITDRDA